MNEYTPTAHLRFVERKVGMAVIRILQQWWTSLDYIPIAGNPDGCIGEWRDVLLEEE